MADSARAQLAEGVNPWQLQRSERVIPPFGEASDALVDDIAPGFRNAKHLEQWRMTLTAYAAPLRSKSVAEITTEDVLSVLKPIWTTKNGTVHFSQAARERIRLEGGGYRRDHLRALAQHVEVGDDEIRIMGSKSDLLGALVAAQGGKSAALGGPVMGLKWRRESPKNL